MSEVKHTPGLLAFKASNDGSGDFGILAIDVNSDDGRPAIIAEAYADIRRPRESSEHEARENARRLVACWNACDHMSIESIEELSTIGGVAALIVYSDDVEKERNVLLAALKRAERKLTAYIGVCGGDKELTEAILPMVRTSISKVKGGAA